MKTTLIVMLLMLGAGALDAQTHEERMRFLDSVNKYRAEAGLRPYIYDSRADTLTKLRNLTVLNYIENHKDEFVRSVGVADDDPTKLRRIMHYGFNAQSEWFNLNVVHQDSTAMFGECGASFRVHLATNYVEYPENLFQGWKGSPEHWKLIMNPKYQYLSLSWEYREFRYRPHLVAHLIVFDTRLRTPDTIKYYKCTNVLRPGYE